MKNEIRLIDVAGNEIKLGDIVKVEYEDQIMNQIFYFLYDKDEYGVEYLFKYDKYGYINETNINSIKVDSSVSLLNKSGWKWTRLGTREEVYNKLFGVK